MHVKLMAITPNSECVIEMAGRTCYDSFNKMNENSSSIIKTWIKSGHESVIEHASATFDIIGVSRALTHQLVRHRLASYSQQSQRYVKEDKFNYVIPDSIINDKKAFEIYTALMENIRASYEELNKMNIAKEDARYVLPNACHTHIVMSANFREWRHFFKLRLHKSAQWEIRLLATYILSVLKYHAPNVFFDFDSDIDGEVLRYDAKS